MRAKELKYSAYEQVKARLRAFEAMNHPTDKVELIVMGGTFLQYSKKFQYKFIKELYDGLNNKISKDLEKAQKLNEKSKHRCVALCIEIRPDQVRKYIDRMREFGCTRVELGVQMPDNVLYKKTKRGHGVKEVIEATKVLRDAGFKIGYHIMPGLPGSNMHKDLRLFKKLFSDSKFKPDQLKLYPCQVICGAELEKLYWKKKYLPYTKKQTEKLLVDMLKAVPRYCRVMRVMREIPPEFLVAGTIRIDLRKDIEAELRNKKSKLKEIRYREIGFALRKGDVDTDLKLKQTKYQASDGEEYFLEIVNKEDILFGLLRLRITNGKAIIRELHIYGQALKLGQRGKLGQHIGLGKWLMNEAEKIVNKNKIKKLSVISGVGVREYYRKLGYKLEDTYMVKDIKT